MQRRELKNLGKDISLLTFGSMRMPETADGKIDRVKALEMIDYAYEHGVTHFDTAWFYHKYESEPFMGEALSRFDRSTITIADKLPLWEVNSREEAEVLFHKQLENLKTDYIDYYLVHAMNKERCELFVKWDIQGLLEELKAAGKIRHIGFSFHDDFAGFEKTIDLYKWEFALIQLNYVDTNHQQGIIGYDMLVERNIPIFIMEPVKGGNLASFSDDIEAMFKSCHPDRSIASWAFNWVANLDGVVTILSGMSNLEQVKDNIETLSNFKKFTEEEAAVFEQVIETLKTRKQINCTACNYCMPCPHGVNIPKNFAVYNDFSMYSNKNTKDWAFGLLVRDKQEASRCIDCGICVDLCPQKLEIPSLLTEVDSIKNV